MVKRTRGGQINKVVGQKKKAVGQINKVRGSEKAVENNRKHKVRVLKIQVVKINEMEGQKNRGM